MALRVGLVVPHIFMQDDILPDVIFSPGELAIQLADQLTEEAVHITLFTAGKVTTKARQINADLTFFQAELEARGDTYLSLLKKYPLTFITLARQAQAALIAEAFQRANAGEFDLIHIYTNEEDLALPFAQFCTTPVVFTHHDPFNFLVGYRNTFPKYKHLNWLSISNSQRSGMPVDTHWVGNIYHGLDEVEWPRQQFKKQDYVAFIGRIIEPKGLDIAIRALQLYNREAEVPLKLKIAGKHYSSEVKDSYWHKTIEPLLADPHVEYVGFIKEQREKQEFLSKARALLIPSTFAEPFGMVMIESLACSTPIIGLDSGAIPEVVEEGETGFVAKKLIKTINGKQIIEPETIKNMSEALQKINQLDPAKCRKTFEERFTLRKMSRAHIHAYQNLLKNHSSD